jgi:NAD(P)-dependent dehydrogenase (short-subunit alcohol dehydrogenase family)
MDLNGNVALITGGGSGIGAATARRLATEGMRVCVVDIDGDAATTVAKSIDGLGLVADVRDAAQVDQAFASCIKEFGTVDLAHLNAGVPGGGPDITAVDDETYERCRSVNLDGLFFGARAAVRAMRSRQSHSGGVIIATASTASIDPFLPGVIYTMTKHGIVGLVRALAPNLADEGIAVHAVCPGVTDTNLFGDVLKARMQSAGIPFISSEEIAEAVVTAATAPLSATGTCWVVQWPGDTPTPWSFRSLPQ